MRSGNNAEAKQQAALYAGGGSATIRYAMAAANSPHRFSAAQARYAAHAPG